MTGLACGAAGDEKLVAAREWKREGLWLGCRAVAVQFPLIADERRVDGSPVVVGVVSVEA